VKPVYCPCCNRRLFDVDESIEVITAFKSNTTKRKADMEIKCPKCSRVVTVRFPRDDNPDIKFARGVKRN